MREIKFRLWDKTNRRMIAEPMLYFTDPHGFLWQSAAGYGMKSDMEAELMQYTGIKDYSEKEIYEGDIVRCQYAEDRGPRFVDVVEWSNCEFKIGTYGLGQIEAEEIIGNIYENPEIINIL